MFESIFNKRKTSGSEKLAEHTILNNRFMLKFPADWHENTVHSFEGPEEDGIKHNILLTIENNVEVLELEKYAEMQIKALEDELQGYHELKRGQITLDSKLLAYELVYRWSPIEDREVYQKAIYILANRTAYALTATFSKKTWKTIGPEVDKIMMSFTIV